MSTANIISQTEPTVARPALIPMGVHFNLDDETYHEDPAIGSTDLRRLLVEPTDYWWNSWFNPLKGELVAEDRKSSHAKIVGKAAHMAVLEGREKFLDRYAPTYHPGNIKAGKEEVEQILAEGKIPIRKADFDRILVASRLIHANPALANAFEGGYSEVSVFWEDRGIRFKARFDYLKPYAITDLKTIRNFMERNFKEACRRRFSDARYDVQAAHYIEGRRRFRDAVIAGNVFWHEATAPEDGGGTIWPVEEDHPHVDLDWVREVASVDIDEIPDDPSDPRFAFVFVFWQADANPAVSWGTALTPANPMLAVASQHIDKAVQNYRDNLSKFGGDAAWIITDPLEELSADEMPPWFQRV